jgi:glycosyltransferase involved in cell wall biosynthesis
MISRISETLTSIAIRLFLAIYGVGMHVAEIVGPPQKVVEGRGFRVLLTGRFYSSNWILAHVKPLAMSPLCEEIRVVTYRPFPEIEKVAIQRPPKWLVGLAGATLARLAVFGIAAVRMRPDVVGGFHLLLNGLTAALVARMIGARALYFCVGGPAEVLDGGLLSENRIFGQLRRPDAAIERMLVNTVSAFDIVIAMGTSAVEFFKRRNVKSDVRIIPGGIDMDCFTPSQQPARFDMIFTGRLVPIKQVDLFLETVRRVKLSRPETKAAVIGDGPLLQHLKRLSDKMGLSGTVWFAGFQSDPALWLNQARVFVLTSFSEGLSLALMEAMACGLPAVVPRTGDLGDLVVDGVNGHLIETTDPQQMAHCILSLLGEPQRFERFSRSARQAAERLSIQNAVEKWNRLFDDFYSKKPIRNCANGKQAQN